MSNLLKIYVWIIFIAGLSALLFSNTSTQGNVVSNSNVSVLGNEIIVMLRSDVPINRVLKSESSNYTKEIISRELNIWLIKANNNIIETDSPSRMLSSLQDNNDVIAAQYNHVVKTRENAPDDPRFDEQWGLSNTGQEGGIPNADIKALKAWDITTGGKTKDGRDVVIAVIDDGFDLNHIDLQFHKNTKEIPNNNIDDDGNGYIDDYNGWNTVTGTDSIQPFDHGTRICGVIGAIGNNNIGVSGVCWDIKILPVQIKANPNIDEASVLKAYAYILKQRKLYNETDGNKGTYIVATNSSFGIDFGRPQDHPIWCEFYNYLGKEGVLNIAATMNQHVNVDLEGDIPTTCPSDYLIAVTSTTRSDELYSGSAYGKTNVDIGAPGISILSTAPGNVFSTAGGTSLAAPHVTGTIGLLYTAAHTSYLEYGLEYPDSLALVIKKTLLKGSDKLSSLNGKVLSDGRLNLFKTAQTIQRELGTEPLFNPVSYSLSQNYPNPFNPSTKISYDVLDAVNIKITVYNVKGQIVKVLVNSVHSRGRHTVNFDAQNLTAGIYFYKIDSKYFTETKKMVLLK